MYLIEVEKDQAIRGTFIILMNKLSYKVGT